MAFDSAHNNLEPVVNLLRQLNKSDEPDTRTSDQVLAHFTESAFPPAAYPGARFAKEADACRLEPILPDLARALDRIEGCGEGKTVSYSFGPSVAVVLPSNVLSKTSQIIAISRGGIGNISAVISFKQGKKGTDTITKHQALVLSSIVGVDETEIPLNVNAYEHWLYSRFMGPNCTIIHRPASGVDAAIRDSLAMARVLLPAAARSTVLFATFSRTHDNVRNAAKGVNRCTNETLWISTIRGSLDNWTLLNGRFFGESVRTAVFVKLQSFIRSREYRKKKRARQAAWST